MRHILTQLFISFVPLMAYDLNQQAANLQEKASQVKVNGDISISKEMQDRARQVGYTFDGRQTEFEAFKNTMSYDNGKVVFNQTQKTKTPIKYTGPFRDDERLYIFVSSSVPKETLVRYAQIIDSFGLGHRVVMVMRGCIGGCEKIKPTLRFINDVITDDGAIKEGLKAQVWIDPLLFRKYGITKAPIVVYAKGINTEKIQLSEGLDQNLKNQPIFYKSEGDWGLEHHIEVLYQKSKSASLQKLLTSMQKNKFYNTK